MQWLAAEEGASLTFAALLCDRRASMRNSMAAAQQVLRLTLEQTPVIKKRTPWEEVTVTNCLSWAHSRFLRSNFSCHKYQLQSLLPHMLPAPTLQQLPQPPTRSSPPPRQHTYNSNNMGSVPSGAEAYNTCIAAVPPVAVFWQPLAATFGHSTTCAHQPLS